MDESEKIIREHPELILDSRYVLTWKRSEGNEEAKARWTLKGYGSPLLKEDFDAGRLTAPTLTQFGKMLVLQTIASFKFDLEIGDTKGAFLEAEPLERRVYARQPPGGLPGIEAGVLVESSVRSME